MAKNMEIIKQLERGLEEPPIGPFTLLVWLLATSVPSSVGQQASLL